MNTIKKIWCLARIQFKTESSNAGLKLGKGKSNATLSRIPSKIKSVAGHIISLVFMLAFSAFLAVQFAEKGSSLSKLLTRPMSMGMLFALMIGIQMLTALLYLSTNNDFYLAMPIKANHLMISRFIACWLFMCIFPLLLMPAILLGGYYNGAGVVYYLVSLTLPFISMLAPMALIGLILMLILSSFKNLPNKDTITKVTTFISTFGFLAFFFYAQSTVDVTSGESWLNADTNVTRIISNIFNPSLYLVARIFDGGVNVVYLILSYVIPLVYLLVLYLVAGKLYLPLLTGGKQTSSAAPKAHKYAKVKESDIRNLKSSRPFAALMKWDWLMIKRSTFLLINTLISLILPLLIVIPSILGIKAAMSPDKSYLELFKELKQYVAFLHQPEIQTFFDKNVLGWIIVGIVALFGSIFAGTHIALAAFSREGSSFFFINQLPLAPKMRIRAKYLMCLLCGPIFHLLIFMIILIVLGVPLIYSIYVFITMLCCLNFSTSAQILLDIKNLYLDWTTEGEMQNRAGIAFKSMAVLLGNNVIVGLANYAIMKYLPDKFFHPSLFLILPVVVSVASFSLLFKVGSKNLIQR